MKRIDLVFKGRKLPVNDPEAVYVAFPFMLHDGKLHFEAQGGMVVPGENQIPGTSNDWNTVQNFAALRSPNAQVVLVSDEIPLMQFGGINTGRYDPAAKAESQQIFSWVLNNYWTTNFPIKPGRRDDLELYPHVRDGHQQRFRDPVRLGHQNPICVACPAQSHREIRRDRSAVGMAICNILAASRECETNAARDHPAPEGGGGRNNKPRIDGKGCRLENGGGECPWRSTARCEFPAVRAF